MGNDGNTAAEIVAFCIIAAALWVPEIAKFALILLAVGVALAVTAALVNISWVAALALWIIGPLAVVWWRYRKDVGEK